MKVKFCGLQRLEDIEALNTLHPDYAGFVFAPHSRRCVSMEQAALLKQALDPSIAAVGVFVNPEEELVKTLVENGIIDCIQLHGQESDEMVIRLHKYAPVIQAFVIQSAADLLRARASKADLILLDAGAGAGVQFDWSLLAGFERPYLLAGGLNPENAAQAAALHPYGLDVSSGIEVDGYKDKEKMAAFLAALEKNYA